MNMNYFQVKVTIFKTSKNIIVEQGRRLDPILFRLFIRFGINTSKITNHFDAKECLS